MLKTILQFSLLTITAITISTCKSPTSSCDDCAEKPDTTSHNFTIQIDTIGNAGSVLWDVAIVNDTNIWVVGDIKKFPLSSSERWNAAHWDGKKWTKKRFLFKNYTGTFSGQIVKTIWYDGEKYLWLFSEIGAYVRIEADGTFDSTNTVEALKGIPAKVWGNTPNNFYVVGGNGSITHYDGQNFSLVDSGTDLPLTDIYGSTDGKEVWACGWNYSLHTVLLRKKGNVFETIWEGKPGTLQSPFYDFLGTVWCDENPTEFIVGSGNIHHSPIVSPINITTDSIKTSEGYTRYYLGGLAHRIRGNAANDVFAVGERGFVQHWNGSTWKNLTGLNETDRLRSISVSKRVSVAVGWRNISLLDNPAIIITIKKQ